jgi:hypothetical protein
VEKLLEGEAEEIGRKAVELAKSGDTVALRLCLERIAPVPKGRPITLSLPSMSTPADVTTALSEIVSQMAEGEITPEEAAVAASAATRTMHHPPRPAAILRVWCEASPRGPWDTRERPRNGAHRAISGDRLPELNAVTQRLVATG